MSNFSPVAIPQLPSATVLGKRSSNDGVTDSKRQRNSSAAPSAVLFMRGFEACGGVTEAELRAVCAPFGQVVKTLIMHTKGQAFVQLQSVAHAVQMQRCGGVVLFQYIRADIKLICQRLVSAVLLLVL